jgi:hypothetical protein
MTLDSAPNSPGRVAPLLVRVLNAALDLDLADFAEARVFLRSPEGDALLEAWLASHPDNDEPNT